MCLVHVYMVCGLPPPYQSPRDDVTDIVCLVHVYMVCGSPPSYRSARDDVTEILHGIAMSHFAE